MGLGMQGSRLLPALIAACALLPASTAGAATCAGLDTPISAASAAAAKTAIVCMVNAERTVRGLPALTPDDRLGVSAQRHTDDMVARNFFSHYAPAPAPYGTDPGSRITAAGYDWQFYGENIAVGYVTPRAVMTGWMASEGHCRNILDPSAEQIGVGVADTPATLLGQAGGTWTQDFGLPSDAHAPSSDTGPQDGCPYQGLIGLTADASDTASSGAPADDSAPAPATPVPTAGTQNGASTPAAVALHVIQVGHGILLSGPIAAADGTPVVITVQAGRHRVRRVRARVRHGHYHARIRLPHRHRHYTIGVSAGTLRITRTIS
ncbi:MAG: hypothetical protein JWM71_453 [Solirubrobacteraceae bacterium]|nr:hypothetical protein [Solirubrobacteraceae bacterium]